MRLLVWGTAVVAYVLAVVGRSALAATGVTAAQRFGASAATLSLLAVLSLAVYAALSPNLDTSSDAAIAEEAARGATVRCIAWSTFGAPTGGGPGGCDPLKRPGT